MYSHRKLTLILSLKSIIMGTQTPDYHDYQSSFHQAFRPELEQLVRTLPVPANGRVIDVPCGNGFYSMLLANRLQAGAELVAADACPNHVAQLQAFFLDHPTQCTTTIREADAYHLPDADRSFDLVWCAESLISLEPHAAVSELHRVVKPTGTVAILEVDEFHHVLMHWPAELEAAMPQAIHEASIKKYGSALKHSPARRLRRILSRTGFGTIQRKVTTFQRTTPFDPLTFAFLRQHMNYLREFIYDLLPEPMQQLFDRSTDPDSERSLLRMPDTELTLLGAVYLARNPGTKREKPPTGSFDSISEISTT